MKKVIIASNNPIKVSAVADAFTRMFKDQEFNFEGLSVESGVSDQPKNNQETYRGALNRANNAYKAAPDADFWVGLEGGVEAKGTEMESFAWMVVRSKQGKYGKAKTSTFILPPKVAELISQGMELGEADDIVFGQTNSKQAGGAVGLLTGNVITRSSYYSEAVILALINFKNIELY